MPTYTFENQSGCTMEVNEPMGTETIVQNGDSWTRTKTPEGCMVNVGAQMPDQRAAMKRGYSQAEDLGWKSKFSKTQVKRIWNI